MAFFKGFKFGAGKEIGEWLVRIIISIVTISAAYYYFFYEDPNKPGYITQTKIFASDMRCKISWDCSIIDGEQVLKKEKLEPELDTALNEDDKFQDKEKNKGFLKKLKFWKTD